MLVINTFVARCTAPLSSLLVIASGGHSIPTPRGLVSTWHELLKVIGIGIEKDHFAVALFFTTRF